MAPATTELDDLDSFVQSYRAKGAPKDDNDDLDSFVKNYSAKSELKTPVPFTSPAPRTSPTEAVSKVATPLTRLAPPPTDTSTTPINVFSGEAQAPGIRTEEETAKLGTIGPASDTAEAKVRRVIPRAFRDQQVTPGDNNIINPEGLMTPVQQENHPILTGIGQAAGGLTSPENVALLGATAGIGEVPGLVGKLAKIGLSSTFGAQMLKGAFDSIPGIQAARSRGDWNEVKRLATLAGINTAMGAAAFAHAGRSMRETAPATENANAAPTPAESPSSTPAAVPPPQVAPDVNKLVSAGKPPQAAPEGHIGPKEEPLAPEPFSTIKAQVDHLEQGTNKVVYIPKGQESVPPPPENAVVTVVPGDKAGAGTYYHTPDVTPELIKKRVADGTFGQLLGNTQGKAEAIAGGKPTAVIARDESGHEVKSSLADSTNPQAVAEQAAVLARQFPNAKIGVEAPEKVVSERLGVPATEQKESPQTAVSSETPATEKLPIPVPATEQAVPQTERRSATSTGAPPTGTAERRTIPFSSTHQGPPEEQGRLLAEYRRRLESAKDVHEFNTLSAQIKDLEGLQGALKIEGGGEEMARKVREGREKSSGQPVSEEAALANQAKRSGVPRTAPTANPKLAKFEVPKTAPTSKVYKARIKEQPLTGKYSPDTLEAARDEMKRAAELAGTFERPGRYVTEHANPGDHYTDTRPNDVYGVSSSRHIVGQQYPWYDRIKAGPGKLAELVERGKGAEHDRILDDVAKGIEQRKSDAKAAVAGREEELRAAAAQVRAIDPALADELEGLAEGRYYDVQQFKDFVDRKIHDSKTAADFNKIFEDHDAEAATENAADRESADLREPGGDEEPYASAEEGHGVSESNGKVHGQAAEPREAPDQTRNQLVTKFSNDETGTEARVTKTPKGFAVTLRDTEYGETLPHVRIYQDKDAAIAKAKEFAGILPGMGETVAEEKAAAGKVQAEKLTEKINTPENIDRAAGEMESKSPLFRGTEASPQKEMFSGNGAKVVSEHAPELKALSSQVTSRDPELATILSQFANGDNRGLDSLENYVAEKVPNVAEANKFYRLIDAAKDEARTARIDERGSASRETVRSNTTERVAPAEGARSSENTVVPARAENVKVGDRVDANGKTFEVTKIGETGVYAREGDGPIKFIKNGEFEPAAPRESKAAPEVKSLLDETASTAYSGLDPALLKFLIPESVRDKIGTEATKVRQSRDLQAGLYDLDSQSAADMIRARDVLKNAPGTPADLENIYHHIEDPSIKLTPEQQKIMASHIKPLIDAAAEAYRKVSEGAIPAENHVHRIAMDKGGILDRILGGKGKLSAGNTLTKSAPGAKIRTMMALEDEDGNRQVVSIKGGTITAWKGGQGNELGRIRGLATQGVKTQGDIIEREIAPLKRELDKLEAERHTLTSSKSREAVSKVRIGNIENRQAELREAMQDAYRKNDGQLYSEADLKDRKFVDRSGKQWTITDATTKEIEGSTKLKYYKNALASSVVDFLQMRRAERAYDFLENYKNSEDFAKVATKMDGKNVPAGYRTTDLPQFRGYAFEPHTAEVLDWYSKRLKSEGPSIYDQVGKFLRDSIFFNPLMHLPNVAVHWAVEKGVTGFAPWNWPRLQRTSSRAIDAVIHQNQDFLDALDEGAPLQSQRLENDATTKLIMQRMGKDLESDHPFAAKLAKVLGYANPLELVKSVYKFSSNATWVGNDIAMLQATYDHMERTGEPFKAAITEVAKHIPDYRLPTRIFDSKALGTLMSSPKLTMFGAYHYGALRSYGEMAKALVDDNIPAPERIKSLDRMAMLGLVTFVAYPALDELAKKLTGDKTAEFRRAGASTFIDNIVKLARGEKTPTDVATAVATPAIGLKTAAELAFNRDIRTGKHIYDPSAPTKTIAKQLGRYAGLAISPIGQAMQVTGGRKTIGQQVAAQFGIRTRVPTPAEALARRFNSERAGSEAPDVDTLERSQLRGQYEDKLRDKSITPGDLAKDRAAGKITAQDQGIILKRAARTPLQNAFRNLDLEQALRVWDKASPEEQKQVRPMLAGKMGGLSKVPESRRQMLRARLISALHPQSSAPDSSQYRGVPMQPPGT